MDSPGVEISASLEGPSALPLATVLPGHHPQSRMHDRSLPSSATGTFGAAVASRPLTGLRLQSVVDEDQSTDHARLAVNVAIAAIALVILLPVFIVIAIAIKLTSPGPVIYRQIRVGLDRRRSRTPATYDRRGLDLGGRIFTMYKFRTMSLDAEREGIVWAQREDGRVTSVGRFLRLSRLDELPQLINVLRGEMNIVGPRPERPIIFSKLRAEISQYSLRQRAKPGITGWAQINQDYDSTIADVRRKVQYDLAYIERQSIAEDFLIMARTIPVMLFRRGAR